MIADRIVEFHEVANLFPLIEGQEFDELVKDIRENGLLQPIWTYQGKIIDGRNRYRACQQAGVQPRYQEWDGKGSLVAFTISLNVKRRHLNSSQLGAISIDVLTLFENEAKERQRQAGGDRKSQEYRQSVPENFQEPIIKERESAVQVAQLLGTNQHYVIDAKKIKEKAPELIEHVKEGTLTIPDAKAIAAIPSKESQAKIVAKAVASKEKEGKRVSRAIQEAIREEEIDVDEKRDDHVMRVMGSSDSPEWYTPREIVQMVREMFGEIDLDPCSNSHDKPAVPARKLYTKEDDGLAHEWKGRVYLNPPYGNEISQWVNKLVASYQQGSVEEALALLPARIDTLWFQPLYDYPMCNVRGRIQYENSPYHAPFPCVIVYLGTREDAFIEKFKSLGPIMRRIS